MLKNEDKVKEYKIGLISLTCIGVGTMIGSGWLFSSYYAAQIAGAHAYYSWIITAIIILILGLCLAEIATVYPKRGLMARLLVISHNKEFGIICAIATWLGLTAVVATEAEGSVQYISSLSPALGEHIFNTQIHELTGWGLLIAIGFILCYGLINYWGIKILSHSNVILTTWKIIIPIITAVTIMFAAFYSGNFSGVHETTSGTSGVTEIFIAMIGAGMIYSFNGFQNIVSFSSEAKNPRRNIPLAMIFAVILTLFIYLLLQTAFIGSITPSSLSKGWSGLNFTSPFVQITAMLNLNLIMIVLYADSVISPAGTGLLYAGSTTRLVTAMAQDGQMPKFFDHYCRFNFSRRSLYLIMILAIMFLLLFRSWTALVEFLSLFYVISYMSIPLALSKLHSKNIKGYFRFPIPKIILPLIFIFLSYLFTCSKFPYTAYVSLFMILAYCVFLASQLRSGAKMGFTIKNSCLMIIYLIVLSFISFIGPKIYDGMGYVSTPIFFLLLIIASLTVFYTSTYYFNNDPEAPAEEVISTD